MRLRKKQPSHAPRWLWGSGIGLGLIAVVVVCVLFVTQNRTSTNSVALETSKPSADISSVLPVVEPTVTAVETLPQVPHIDFPRGSWEEACGLNELPPYWVGDGSLKQNEDHTKAFESVECQTALETYMNAVNPYHILWSSPWDIARPMRFVVLEDSLTFERVFADPVGDLARVQDALSRPECLLQGDDINWELKETCHADAFLNFALINSFCFKESEKYIGRAKRAYYLPNDNPSPEQDRLMWKQDFENAWVSAKCEGLDPELKITSDRYPVLYELVGPVGRFDSEERKILTLLVELAARLGDDAAGLTESDPFSDYPPGRGYQYGRFSELWERGGYGSLRKAGAMMRMYRPSEEPTKLFLSAFNFLARITSRDEIEFDWEWVVQHICVPVVLPPSTADAMGAPDPTEIQSCKEIVHEIRQKGITFPPLVKMLDKFEQVAIELGVYE